MNFVLYARSNCPLCEAMEEDLSPFIDKYNISIKRQFIDNESELEQLYGSKVPVLTFNNETVCEYFLDSELLLNVINP